LSFDLDYLYFSALAYNISNHQSLITARNCYFLCLYYSRKDSSCSKSTKSGRDFRDVSY